MRSLLAARPMTASAFLMPHDRIQPTGLTRRYGAVRWRGVVRPMTAGSCQAAGMEGPVEGEGGGEAGEIVRRRRRWPAVVAAVLVAAVAVGWWVWFRWLPGYRPGLEAGEPSGADLAPPPRGIGWGRGGGGR